MSRIPSSAQPVAAYTLNTGNTTTFDTAKYDSSMYEVSLNFDLNASSSIAKIETSNDDLTYTIDAGKVTPATTGATIYRYICGSSARYIRVYLTTPGGTSLTVTINPL